MIKIRSNHHTLLLLSSQTRNLRGNDMAKNITLRQIEGYKPTKATKRQVAKAASFLTKRNLAKSAFGTTTKTIGRKKKGF